MAALHEESVRAPRRLPNLPPIAEVAVSTYVTAAVAVDGRVATWGDSDGGALGHARLRCHAPAWVSSVRGLHAVHASLSYTNGAVATSEGRVFVWGGNAWEGGLAEGRASAAPSEVAWGGVPSCYRCSAVVLSYKHGFLVFRRAGGSVV